MRTTGANIEYIAETNGMTAKTVIQGVYSNIERMVVNMGGAKAAYFIMNNETFDFTFEKVYNAATDKTSYRLPKIFKS